MKIAITILLLLASVKIPAVGQSRFQIAISGGLTFTPDTKFRNCTGHISNALTNSLSLLYRIDTSFGLELKFTGLGRPTSYLESNLDNTVKIYSTSQIEFSRVLAGFNYYVPMKEIHPFVGIVAGVSHPRITETYPYSSTLSFTIGLQTGAALKLSKLIAMRLDACAVWIPGVSNASSYFGADSRSGYPFFILGDPSQATIKQYNVNLGVLITFRGSKK